MRRRSALLSLLLLPGSLALATAVAAGGMAIITVTDVPPEPTPGEDTTIGFLVMQHGETAVSWPKITLVATESSSGTVVLAPSRAEGGPGEYVSSIVFPTAGDWRLTFDSPDLQMEGSALVHVPEPVVAAPVVSSASETAAAATPATDDVLPIVVALAFIAVAMGVAGLALRGRRQPKDIHAPAGS
jgi:hypothetical protein